MTIPLTFTASTQGFSSSFSGLQSSASNDGTVIAVLSTVSGIDTLFVSKDSGVSYQGHTLATLSLRIKVSYDGLRIYVVMGTGSTYHINFSDDYGANFTQFSQVFSNTQYGGFDVSDTEEYIVIIDGTEILYSNDYGSSFNVVATISAGIHDLNLSGDGKTITALAGGNLFYQSKDSGVTWNTFTITGSASVQNFAISDDSKYILCSENKTNGKIWISSDSGVTFADVVTTFNLANCSISLDGKIMLVSPNSTSDQLLISFDYGATWQQAGPSSGGSFATILGSYDFYIGYSISSSVYLYSCTWAKAPVVTPSQITTTVGDIVDGKKPAIGTTTTGPSYIPKVVIPKPTTGTPQVINITKPDGTVIATTTLPPGALPSDILTIRLDGQYIIVLFNGKILVTYKLDPWTFPDLFTGNGWLGWIDGSNNYIIGATPAATPAPITGYKYNFQGKVLEGPIGYEGWIWSRGKQWRGVSVLFMPDGSNYSAQEPLDTDYLLAKKAYFGGRNYIVLNEEAIMLNNAGYGDYLTDIS